MSKGLPPKKKPVDPKKALAIVKDLARGWFGVTTNGYELNILTLQDRARKLLGAK